MKTLPLLCAFSLLLGASSVAQTQLVRGDVDGIQGTQLFQLDCTGIRLVSSTVSLAALEQQSRQNDIEYEMLVRDVSVGGQTTLDVLSATVINEQCQMGNLRFGRSETWEVFGTPGSTTVVFTTARAFTSYTPFGSAGTWLLGPTFLTMNQGTINPLGEFRFNFQMPTMPALVGAEFTSQALILEPSTNLIITNPDCKEVRT